MKVSRKGQYLITVASLCAATTVMANHPVLVEGEKDFDGDGLVGIAEDNDNNTDRIFGTITAALSALNGGAAQNGRVTIVTSGRFAEQLVINGTNGNVTVEAAPGVEANIDAVVAGARGSQFPNGNNVTRQEVAGIIVETADNRRVVLRNLVIRNWAEGIIVMADSHVAIDNCRLEGNRDYGIHVIDRAKVAITDCDINGTGFRVGAATNNAANPGNAIEFDDWSSGLVCNTTVTGSFGAGIRNSCRPNSVRLQGNCLFDNHPDVRLQPHRRGDRKDD